MATLGNVSSTLCTGNVIAYSSGGTATWNVSDDAKELKEFVSFALRLMGIDMDFEKFKSMTDAEKKALLREQKINKIIE
jgi:hypothetical protein